MWNAFYNLPYVSQHCVATPTQCNVFDWQMFTRVTRSHGGDIEILHKTDVFSRDAARESKMYDNIYSQLIAQWDVFI